MYIGIVLYIYGHTHTYIHIHTKMHTKKGIYGYYFTYPVSNTS